MKQDLRLSKQGIYRMLIKKCSQFRDAKEDKKKIGFLKVLNENDRNSVIQNMRKTVGLKMYILLFVIICHVSFLM